MSTAALILSLLCFGLAAVFTLIALVSGGLVLWELCERRRNRRR